MSTELLRKYMDIVNESQQLDEGLIDSILKPLAAKFVKMIGGDQMAEIADKVQQATGGDLSLTTANSVKVAKALGFDENTVKAQTQESAGNVTEGIAGNWQGKLIQLAYTAATAGGLLTAFTGAGGPWIGKLIAIIGGVLLLGVTMIYGGKKGQVGAMGKYGNQGLDTSRGPRYDRDEVDLSTGKMNPEIVDKERRGFPT
jgi:hypothetical protein